MAGNGAVLAPDLEERFRALETDVNDFKKQSAAVFAKVCDKGASLEDKRKTITDFRFKSLELEKLAGQLAQNVPSPIRFYHLSTWATGLKDATHSFESAANEVLNDSAPDFGLQKLGEVAKVLRSACEQLVSVPDPAHLRDAHKVLEETVEALMKSVKKVSKMSGAKDLAKSVKDILKLQEELTLSAWEVSVGITFGPIRTLFHRATKFTLVLIDDIAKGCAKGDKAAVKARMKGWTMNQQKLTESLAVEHEDEFIGKLFTEELIRLNTLINSVTKGAKKSGSGPGKEATAGDYSIVLTPEEGKMLAELLKTDTRKSVPKSRWMRFVYTTAEEEAKRGESGSSGSRVPMPGFPALRLPISLLPDAEDDPFDSGGGDDNPFASAAGGGGGGQRRRGRAAGIDLGSPAMAPLTRERSQAQISESSSRRGSAESAAAGGGHNPTPSGQLDLDRESEEMLALRARARQKILEAALQEEAERQAAAASAACGEVALDAPEGPVNVPIGAGFVAFWELTLQLMRALGMRHVFLEPFVRGYGDLTGFMGEVANSLLTTTKRPSRCKWISLKYKELSDSCFQFCLALGQLSIALDPSRAARSVGTGTEAPVEYNGQNRLSILYQSLPSAFCTLVSALNEWFEVCRLVHDLREGSSAEPSSGFNDRTGEPPAFYLTEDYSVELLRGKQIQAASKKGKEGEWADIDPERIVAGTFPALVQHITDPRSPDPLFMKAMVQGFRSFTTASHFLHILIDRFHHPILRMFKPEELMSGTLEAYENDVRPMQLRVCQVVCLWTDREPFLFNEPENAGLRDELVKLATEIEDMYPQLAEKIRINISKGLEQVARSIALFNSLHSQLHLLETPLACILLENDLETVARQLTLAEFSLFHSIQPTELCCLAWSKPNLKHLAPSVLATHVRFNAVSRFFCLCVLCFDSAKQRAKVISRCMLLAERLRGLNNFASLNAIIAALHNAAVTRLKASWSEVPKRESQLLKEYTDLMSNQNSYKKYRSALRDCIPPVCPFLGMSLTDLTFIEEGNPDTLNGLLNFSKVELSYNVIEQVQNFQQIPYSFERREPLYSMLAALPDVRSPKLLFELSKLREAQKS